MQVMRVCGGGTPASDMLHLLAALSPIALQHTNTRGGGEEGGVWGKGGGGFQGTPGFDYVIPIT